MQLRRMTSPKSAGWATGCRAREGGSWHLIGDRIPTQHRGCAEVFAHFLLKVKLNIHLWNLYSGNPTQPAHKHRGHPHNHPAIAVRQAPMATEDDTRKEDRLKLTF